MPLSCLTGNLLMDILPNSVDQMRCHNVASHLGPHCLLKLQTLFADSNSMLLLYYFVLTCDHLKHMGLEETCLRGFEENTGTDQPAHPHSLISAFVISLCGKYHI